MTRPFSQTMQAHRLDQDRLWMALLVASILMALAWIGWATSDSEPTYETSTRIKLDPKVDRFTVLEERGNVTAPEARRRRWLEASFPAAAREHIAPGVEAVVLVGGAKIPAVITEAQDDPEKREVRATLRVESPDDAPDPFATNPPERARISTGARVPLEVWLPEAAPSGTSKAPEKPRTPR